MRFIFASLALLFIIEAQSETMQKRRYKKRHHKVQIGAGNLNFSNEFDAFGDIKVNYAYNWGHFELGVLFGLSPDLNLFNDITEFDKMGLLSGLSFEGNFIKNKRRNNWIPSGGLKVYYMLSRDSGLWTELFLSSKHFISSRTSINIELGYPLQVWEWDSSRLFTGFNLDFAYAYYFH